MRNKIFSILATTVLGLLICCSVAFPQAKGEIYQVDITHDVQGWHITPCPLPGISGDTWRIHNTTKDSLCVFILKRAEGLVETTYALTGDTSVDHSIKPGDWAIAVKSGSCGGYPSFLAACSFSPTSHPPHNVTIKQENEEWEIQPCPLPVDTQWVFYDSTSSLIILWLLIPVRTNGEPQPFRIVPGWGYATFPAYVWGGVEVKVFDLHHSQMLAYCKNPDGPTLTQWGAIALVVSLTVVTVWILLKKRRQVA